MPLVDRGHSQIRNHAPIATARTSMREKLVYVVTGTPGAHCDPGEARSFSSLHQCLAQVQPNRARHDLAADPHHDFRSNFIALSTNAYTTVHYNISSRCLGECGKVSY